MTRLAAALLLCAACGGSRTEWPGDPEMYGVDLVVTPDATSWASATDAKPRLREVLNSTAGYFGFDPAGLVGLRIVLQGSAPSCGENPRVLGCYQTGDNTATIQTLGWGCLEAASVEHELLHYFIGDPGHTDPRWATFRPLLDALICDRPDCWNSYQCG